MQVPFSVPGGLSQKQNRGAPATPDMPFPFTASPYNNRRARNGLPIPSVHTVRLRPSCPKEGTGTLPAHDQPHHAILQRMPPSISLAGIGALTIVLARLSRASGKQKGYIHASPATGTNAAPAVHGPPLCSLPPHGCLRSCAPQDNPGCRSGAAPPARE